MAGMVKGLPHSQYPPASHHRGAHGNGQRPSADEGFPRHPSQEVHSGTARLRIGVTRTTRRSVQYSSSLLEQRR